jgi:hypothetical protein
MRQFVVKPEPLCVQNLFQLSLLNKLQNNDFWIAHFVSSCMECFTYSPKKEKNGTGTR